MEWGERLIGHLERAFQIEHLSCPQGRSYGAGHPISASDLLQSSILREDMEHYPELLLDEWSAQHLIDHELGLEILLEFDLGDSEDSPDLVQYLELDTDFGKSYLGCKTAGRSLDFLLAFDTPARDTLIPASLLALLAADAAFGESSHEIRLPDSIANNRPDVVSEAILQRGISLMLDQAEGRGSPAWDALADRQGLGAEISHDSILESYFASVYVESESW
jgi:hypothetical protein